MLTGYTGIAILFAVAAVVSLIFKRLKQPQILGYIIAGALLAQFLVSEASTMTLISDMGITLLAFTMGMELNFDRLRSIGSRAFAGVVIELMIMIPAGYLIATTLHWTGNTALFFAAAFALTSTTIVSKTLIDTKESLKGYSDIVLGLLVAEDLMTVLLLAALSGIGKSGSVSIGAMLLLSAEILLFLTVSMVLAVSLLPRCVNWVADLGSDEVLVVFSLGLCFMLALFTQEIGFSFVIGAFVAGVAVAESGRRERISMKLSPVRDIFLAVFFVSIGTLISFKAVPYLLPLALIVAAAFIVFKFIAVTFGFTFSGFTLRQAAMTGVAAGALGEFSFVIAGLGMQYGVLGSNIFTLLVLVSIVTLVVLPLTIVRTERIAERVERAMPKWLVAYRYALSTLNYRKEGRRDNEFRRLISSATLNGVLALSMLILTFSLAGYTPALMRGMGDYYLFFNAGYLAMIIILLYASYNTLTAEAELYLSGKEWSYSVTQKLVRRLIMCIYIIATAAVVLISLHPLFSYTFIPWVVILLAVAVIFTILRRGAEHLTLDIPRQKEKGVT